MKIDCIENMIKNYNSIVKYPVLGLYLKERSLFLSKYIVIDEISVLNICDRESLEMVCINKSDFTMDLLKLPLVKNKKSKEKIFSFRNIEIYKSSTSTLTK